MQVMLNLATRRYYTKARFRLVLLLLFVSLVLLAISGTIRLSQIHGDVAKLTDENAGLDKLLAGRPSGVSEKELTHRNHQVEALNRILARRYVSRNELLDMLEEVTPNGVTYTLISPDQKEKAIKLEGRVRSLKTLSTLMERLDSVKGYRNPKLMSTGDATQQTMPDQPQGIRFVITLGRAAP